MKAAGWLKRGVKQLQRRTVQAAGDTQPLDADGWHAPELPAAPEPEAGVTDLRGWLEQVSAAAVVVGSEAPEADACNWYVQRLAELKNHLNHVQHSGPDQFDVLQEFVAGAMQTPAGLQAVHALPGVHQRVLLWLTAHGRRSDVLLVLADLQDNGRGYPLSPGSRQTGGLTAEPSYLAQLSNPVAPELLRLTEADLPLAARLTRFSWNDDGLLELSGWAYLPGIDPAECTLEIGLRPAGSATAETLVVSRGHDSRVDAVAGDRWMSYAGSAFTATVDPRVLPGLDQQSGGAAEWSLEVTVGFGGVSVSGLFLSRDADTVPRRLPVGPLVDERTRIIGLMDGTGGLRLKRLRYSCGAVSLAVDGSIVTVSFDPQRGVIPSAVHLERPEEPPLEFRTTDSSRTSFAVDLSASGATAGGKDKRWTVQAVLPNGRSEPVGWAGSGRELASVSDPSASLRAECTGYGYLQIALRPVRVTLNSAEISPDGTTLTLEGRVGQQSGCPEPSLPEMLLLTARNEVRPLSTTWLDNTHRFRTELPLQQNKWGHGDYALEAGHYRVLHAVTDDAGRVRNVRVPALGHLFRQLPLRAERTLAAMELAGEGNEQDLVLRVSAPRPPADRTALGRGRLIANYRRSTEAVDPGTVLFETFDGKSCSDSGRAISDVLGTRRPDLRRYWTVADFSVPAPPNCTPVLRESPEWFRLLATAGYLVNNNNFPHYFRKRPNQFYLQTWHGTPLKRIGMDTPVAGSTASYRELMQREAAAWDMLLAQNDFAAETLMAAFGYRGRTAVLGYPRNAALADESAPRRREDARDRLGIAAGQKVLLYMPTWRDRASAANPYLDFELAAKRLGLGFVLLYRGHHKIAGRRKTTSQSLYTDVTTYPDVNDLYLAADLLVTDYSSAMFDFCVTCKPMYFLTPDLAHYRDSERGFYFDFEAQAPGPLVDSTEELAGTILSDEANEEPYASLYREFMHRYAHFDDAAAALRVVEAVWEEQENRVASSCSTSKKSSRSTW
ncbi:CDP-glycerol glycerophosphotransferase family protein [Arthrobacter sp. ZGTC212]|uniref:CDP-glycerol glycerophosphotransferase family protein n=1 Tax=Arthrobacter sp. ZGTC212 TaxID=2058899 RepID=UPI0015E253BE|nr:CDP-glycerol glycerophosphotransferase family protein [Arthrobacter sp. ZGTC212]